MYRPCPNSGSVTFCALLIRNFYSGDKNDTVEIMNLNVITLIHLNDVRFDSIHGSFSCDRDENS